MTGIAQKTHVHEHNTLQVLQKIDTLSRRASGSDLLRNLSSVDDQHIKQLMAESGPLRGRDGKRATFLSLQPSKSTPAQAHITAAPHNEHDHQQLDICKVEEVAYI